MASLLRSPPTLGWIASMSRVGAGVSPGRREGSGSPELSGPGGMDGTMMVATYDVTNQRAAVMSLPRDTLINSSARPNINAKKLNAVWTAS